MAVRGRRGSKAAQETQETTEMTTETTTPDFTEPDFDVDAPAPADAAEDTVEAPTADEKPAKESKTTRPAVPEGFIAPVEFAKVLTEHLKKNGQMPEGKTEVKPQEVYSYVKNNGPNSKNPFPQYAGDAINPETGQPYAPGRKVVLKAEEGIAWWDAKVERVKATKQAAAEKASKKAAKKDETVTETATVEQVLEEAE